MKRTLLIIAWTIAGYLIGAVAVGFLSGLVISVLVSYEVDLQPYYPLMRGITMGLCLIITAVFLVLGLRRKLPGTR